MECRGVGFAAFIFHIRWRLAWNRFDSHACRSWRFTASAGELGSVERSSNQHDANLFIPRGVRTASHSRSVDTHRGDLSCFAPNLADDDDDWRPVGPALAGNHRRRSRHARAGLMVCRCSTVWVEARGTFTAQNQLQLLKSSFTNHRNFWLEGGCYFPSLEFAICPVVGLSANGTR